MQSWRWLRRAPIPPVDPYDASGPRFTAFLDQARWLLAEQQRRGASFQQTAVALLGFDGVLLALLVGDDTLSGVTRFSTAWWAGATGAILFVLSAAIGVAAIIPQGTYAVSTVDTVDAWTTFIEEGGWRKDTYHFAHMLLDANPPVRGPQRGHATAARMRKAMGLPAPPTQALRSAERLATRRGRLASLSAALLLVGVAALLVFLFTAPPPDSNGGTLGGETSIREPSTKSSLGGSDEKEAE